MKNDVSPSQASALRRVLTPTRTERLILISGVAIALAFAAYTQHVWEDYYITYRSSQNLVRGFGLVFQPGERVHAFTSPIGVLLPALIAWLTGNGSHSLVLWIFRAICAALFVGTGCAVIRAHRFLDVASTVTAVSLVLLATEAKIVDFSVNGQESAFLVFFLCASWACLSAPQDRRSIGPLAVVWAGLQYTRPDGCVYGTCLAAGVLIFAPTDGESRWREGWRLVQAAALAALLYAPWFLWTWHYYGTPLPHTIVAKQIYAPGHDFHSILNGLRSFVADAAPLGFGPIYTQFGGWPPFVVNGARCLGMVCALYWLVPHAGRHARAMSFAFALSLGYLTLVISPSPWYLPAPAAFGVLSLGLIGQDLVRLRRFFIAHHSARAARLTAATHWLAGAAVIAFTASLLLLEAFQLRIQQREIETGTRMQIGLWLRKNARPSDRVFLEPLGYIGFFSGRKMLDFPGLASPEVVAARRELHTAAWGPLIARLAPEWLVLRSREASRVFDDNRELAAHYQQAAAFDAVPRLDSYPYIPGRGYLEYDAVFLVFRRVSPDG